MSLETNKETVRLYVAAFNAGDHAAIKPLFTEDAVIHGVLGQGGLDFALPIWKMLHESLCTTLTIEELSAEGQVVAARYTERGTMVGQYLGHSPTNKPYTVPAIEWFHLRDGKIARRWGARDSASISKQIGIG